ncbi:MAG: ACT domain-containing protein, partial [Kiloniellales bacterium]|nr:ACT domain-containing protein [Kiloniellales bacterium]
IPSRLRVFKVQPRVLIDNKASRRYTVIEVNGRDRPGLLHQVTRALTRLNLIIHSARISTFGERVVDTFYVNDPLGDKVEDERRLTSIRKKILAALEDPDCAPEKPKANSKEKAAASKPRKEKGAGKAKTAAKRRREAATTA